MRPGNIILYTLIAAAAVACDDGRIYDDAAQAGGGEATATVRFSGRVAGLDSWTGGYTVAVAGFGDSDYAEVAKAVTAGELEMGGITGDIRSVELCVINRLRKRVATFASVGTAKGSDGYIHLDAGDVDAGMYAAVQTAVFDAACVQCHGGSNHSAASLNLTAPGSREALVDCGSVKEPGMMRVVPGDASASVLWRALATDMSDDWAYRHHTIISNTTSVSLVKDWIDAGAKTDLP